MENSGGSRPEECDGVGMRHTRAPPGQVGTNLNGEDLTLTPHAMRAYMVRAGIESQIDAADELRAIANSAKKIGEQQRKRTGGRGRNNTELVCVWSGSQDGKRWNLFIC